MRYGIFREKVDYILLISNFNSAFFFLLVQSKIVIDLRGNTSI